jgi:hypothetical protein
MRCGGVLRQRKTLTEPLAVTGLKCKMRQIYVTAQTLISVTAKSVCERAGFNPNTRE